MLVLALALAAQDAEFLPLKIGTTWSYRMSTGQTLEMRVAGTSVVASRPCTVLENVLGLQKTLEHVAVTADGLTAYKVENSSGALEYPTPILRVKLPFKAGETWTVQLQEGGQLNTYQYRCDGPETVKVPAGSFEAWKVTATLRLAQGQAVMSVWYGKGAGMIKQVYDVNGQVMTAELATSSLQAAPEPKPGPRTCGKCGAVDKAAGKFCAECATPFPK